MKVQRLRVTFSRGEAMKYVTHLDMMRFWERALRRAGLPVAYSEGFSPHAQISMAAPLAVGVTSEAEIMDVFMERAVTPGAFVEMTKPQLTDAISVLRVQEAGLMLPSLQADVRAAEYHVDVPGTPKDVESAVATFMSAETVPWEHRREDEVRSYDIRAVVREMRVIEPAGEGAVRLRMVLKNDSTGSGRPEQVVAAMGLTAPRRIHRTKLVLAGASGVRAAWRTRGRFEI